MSTQTTQDEITNAEDIIDSRNVVARIEWLEGELSEYITDDVLSAPIDSENGIIQFGLKNEIAEIEGLDPDYVQEFINLKTLENEAEGYSGGDWPHGSTLIRDSYFKDYIIELAEDCYQIPSEWPFRCIDWDQAAMEAQQDYTSVEFDGITYWIR